MACGMPVCVETLSQTVAYKNKQKMNEEHMHIKNTQVINFEKHKPKSRSEFPRSLPQVLCHSHVTPGGWKPVSVVSEDLATVGGLLRPGACNPGPALSAAGAPSAQGLSRVLSLAAYLPPAVTVLPILGYMVAEFRGCYPVRPGSHVAFAGHGILSEALLRSPLTGGPEVSLSQVMETPPRKPPHVWSNGLRSMQVLPCCPQVLRAQVSPSATAV